MNVFYLSIKSINVMRLSREIVYNKMVPFVWWEYALLDFGPQAILDYS